MDAISFLILLSFIGILEAGHCPKDEDMVPCKCFSDPFRTRVECRNLLNPDELVPPFQALERSGTPVDALTIEKSSLLYLPDNIFKNMHIDAIVFKMSEIISLSENETAFTGLEDSLVTITAGDITAASQWDFSQLRNLHSLEYIWLLNVILGAIDHPFPYLPRLYRLIIDGAELSFVSDDAFSNLSELEVFRLMNNNIKELKRSMFPNPATKLHTLDLNGNMLTSLPGDFFDDMPSLSTVYLDRNKFMTLTEKPFSDAFSKLQKLIMSGNLFRCDCRMRWLVGHRFPSEFKAKCSSPSTLDGRNIKDLDIKSLWC